MQLKESSLFKIKELIFSDLKMITSEIMKIIMGVNRLAKAALLKFNIIPRESSLEVGFQASQVKIICEILGGSAFSALKA